MQNFDRRNINIILNLSKQLFEAFSTSTLMHANVPFIYMRVQIKTLHSLVNYTKLHRPEVPSLLSLFPRFSCLSAFLLFVVTRVHVPRDIADTKESISPRNRLWSPWSNEVKGCVGTRDAPHGGFEAVAAVSLNIKQKAPQSGGEGGCGMSWRLIFSEQTRVLRGRAGFARNFRRYFKRPHTHHVRDTTAWPFASRHIRNCRSKFKKRNCALSREKTARSATHREGFNLGKISSGVRIALGYRGSRDRSLERAIRCKN